MKLKVGLQSLVVIFIVFIIGISLAIGVFNQLSDIPKLYSVPAHKEALRRKKRYFAGNEEIVTFFARESKDSERMIARRAFLIRRPGAEVTVFMFHGFMCNKHDIRFLANSLFGQPLGNKPFNIMIIDFRAHGEIPEGQCCSFGYNEMYDVMGAVEFAKADPELKKTKRVAYGFSMGAVSSILAQSQDPTLFDMAIWDCPFESTENVIGRALDRLKLYAFGYELPLPGRSILQKYAYTPYVQNMLKFALKTIAKIDATPIETCIVPVDTVSAMSSITIPIMIIGCKSDEKIPIAAFKEIYGAAQGYKRLWLTNGRMHFDSYFYNPEKYIYKVRRFIQKALDGTIKHRYQEYISEDGVDERRGH
jgi:esterase/lipase